MDEINVRLDNHEHRIADLEQGFEAHNRLFVGHMDENTNQWVDGFAQQLSDVTIELREFVKAFKSTGVWIARGIATCVIPPTLGGVWYILTHLAKIEALLK